MIRAVRWYFNLLLLTIAMMAGLLVLVSAAIVTIDALNLLSSSDNRYLDAL